MTAPVELCHEPAWLYPSPRSEDLWLLMSRRNDAPTHTHMCTDVRTYTEPGVFPQSEPSARPVGGHGALRGAASPGFKRGPEGAEGCN